MVTCLNHRDKTVTLSKLVSLAYVGGSIGSHVLGYL